MTYRLVNRVLLLVGILMALAIAVVHLRGGGICGWRALAGRECLVCGCTRDFFSLIAGRFNFINPLSPVIFATLALELAYRSVASCVVMRGRGVVLSDMLAHGVLVSVFLAANLRVMLG